ncbi:unnamed protein product [Echinostoma caproni]|uniref:Uncharacterized protein n=1 Tax=Echinostoma caproni TaxID=27848 RepID=A0A183B0K6_9TREM|nr:unnamed protein product [Echinostoma caproni]
MVRNRFTRTVEDENFGTGIMVSRRQESEIICAERDSLMKDVVILHLSYQALAKTRNPLAKTRNALAQTNYPLALTYIPLAKTSNALAKTRSPLVSTHKL